MSTPVATNDVDPALANQTSPRSPIARRRRNTELMLIIMVGLITGAAYTVAALGTNALPRGVCVEIEAIFEIAA